MSEINEIKAMLSQLSSKIESMEGSNGSRGGVGGFLSSQSKKKEAPSELVDKYKEMLKNAKG